MFSFKVSLAISKACLLISIPHAIPPLLIINTNSAPLLVPTSKTLSPLLIFINSPSKHYQLIQELSLKFKEKFNSINCATLLNIKNEISEPIPEKRSKEYYLKRPCGNYIYHMAKIMQEYLENE